MSGVRLTRAQRSRRMKAIRLAASGGLFMRSSLTDGLRAVLLFERTNGVAPNPRDFRHHLLITNTGWWFSLQRRLAARNANLGHAQHG